MLGPGVDGDVRLGDDAAAADAMGAEAVKNIGDDGAARLDHGVHDQRSQGLSGGGPFSIAGSEVDQVVLVECVHLRRPVMFDRTHDAQQTRRRLVSVNEFRRSF